MKQKHILPADIERTSMEIIEAELREKGMLFSPEIAVVVKRVIHTTADFEYAETLYFSKDAIKEGVDALRRGAVIVTDTNMAKSGINQAALRKLDSRCVCFMAEEEIAVKAKQLGCTRAAVSMEKAGESHPDGIFAIGNAPTAALRLCDLIETGLRPSLIIGVPVGFVNVVESKERLIEICDKYEIPVIVARGRKGGSTVAAAVCNALLYLAGNLLDPVARGW